MNAPRSQRFYLHGVCCAIVVCLFHCLLRGSSADEPFGTARIDLSHWKLTLPVAEPDRNRPLEISGRELAEFKDPRHFFLSPADRNSLVFRAHCGGTTTENTKYPRCELREMASDGQTEIGWSTDSPVGRVMEARLAVHHLPERKRHVVALQIHDRDDDLLMLRLEDSKLFIERNDLPVVMLDRHYQLGTVFDLSIVAGRGAIRVKYEGQEVLYWKVSRQGCYFKAGCYTQSNQSKGDAEDAFGEVRFYRLTLRTETASSRFVTNDRLVLGTQQLRSASVRAADLNGDGKLDVVVANGRHWPQQNMAFLNQGRARFHVARPLGADWETSYAVEPADLDGDGDLDLVVGNDLAPSYVLINDGEGRFQRKATLGTPASVRSVTVADVNNDQFPDVLLTCRGQANRIFFNDGQAGFSDQSRFGTEQDSTLAVAVADVNGDQTVDLILANRDRQPNVILMGIDGRSFAKPQPFGDPKQSSRTVVTADFNADGHVDWAVANLGDQNLVFFGDGRGGILETQSFGRPDGNTYGLAVADLDRDGTVDLVACNVGQPGTVSFHRNGVFEVVEFGDAESATYGCCVGDFDGDGAPDIAVANSGGVNRIFLNRHAVSR